jgi:E1A/CREB-binding protein
MQMMNNRSLSAQRLALEASLKDQDSPPVPPSPQNTNRGKLDQKLGDDIKSKMDIDDDDKNESGDAKIKTEDSEDHKMGSKSWIDPSDIKKEKDDGTQLDMNTNVINRDGWDDFKEIKREPKMEQDDVIRKIKEEAMSPASSSDNQAVAKPDLKLEPVPQTTDKKKKCSEYFLSFFCSLNLNSNKNDFLAFKPEELCEALLPTLEKLVRLEPESLPFRTPVDPTALGIPDYLDIIKKPMDLGTIEKKLRKGEYSDPWEYVDDVWLMFDNAWLYNRKTSRVYRYCTKVRKMSVFNQKMN